MSFIDAQYEASVAALQTQHHSITDTALPYYRHSVTVL